MKQNDKTDTHIFAENAPEMLNDLSVLVANLAKEQLDIDDNTAKQLGIAVAIKVAEDWGGVAVYIPTNLRVNLAARDMEMYKKFNGYNHAQLAREFKCSTVWVYKVIKRVRQQLQDKQQPQLPF